jgi:hypothetical protein
MWMLLPIFCLAVIHISGNNVALIPDLIGVLATESYIPTILVYVVLGGMIAGLTAWIGVKSGLDLVSITKVMYGPFGKKISACCLLGISIPASALTGGYYAGGIIQIFTGMSYWSSSFLCLVLFALLSIEANREVVKISNYIGLLLLPLLGYMYFLYDLQFFFPTLGWGPVNWLLAFGLVGYNVGGMWSALLVEAASYLAPKGNQGILVLILAKAVEGILTLVMVHLVLVAGTQGPLSLAGVVSVKSGPIVVAIFYGVLFCIFSNTMAPAMFVNGRQVSSLTGLSFWPALAVATGITYGLSFLKISLLLVVMGYTSILMILFITYTAYFLHKYGINKP